MKKNVSVLLMFMFINVIGLWAQDPVKVLFIGNSYTSANDLPGTFRQLAAGMGRDVTTSSVNPGGYTFNQHSVYAATLTAIQSAKWDYVILQEQSQLPSFPPSQVTVEVFPYARKLDSLIRLNDSCTETVFYMTWGRKTAMPATVRPGRRYVPMPACRNSFGRTTCKWAPTTPPWWLRWVWPGMPRFKRVLSSISGHPMSATQACTAPT